MDKIEKLKIEVKNILFDEKSGHDWWHTIRVFNNACFISKKESFEINHNIIKISALLHDVADHKFGYSDADRKRVILEIFEKINLDMDIYDDVVYIVNNISYSNKMNGNLSIEGKIVQDADRLDALGYIGIARTFTYGGYKGRSMYLPNKKSDEEDTIKHFYDKLLIIGNTMNTQTARIIAQQRTKKIQTFLDGFIEEWDSKDLENIFV